MQTKILSVLTLLASCLVAACGGGDEEGVGPTGPVTTTTYNVSFGPEQVIAASPVGSSVTASASIQSAAGEEITASGTVTINGAAANSVTVNAGYAGETGPAVLTLTSAGGGTWNVPAGTILEIDENNRLQDAGFYINIDTASGQLRGQILPQGWELLSTVLTSGEAVPASSSSGSAVGGAAVHRASGALRVRITTNGLDGALGANLRSAIAGARGDVAITLEQSMSDPAVWGTRDVNDVNASDRLTPTGLDLFATGSLYLSVDTAAEPEGAVRAQLLPDDVGVFVTVLTDDEVVSSGAPVVSTGTATAIVTWREATSEFGVAVNTDLADATSVFVGEAPSGATGSFLFSLTPDVMVPGNWSFGLSTLTGEQVTSLQIDELFVSINTPAFPEGELRGQLNLDYVMGTAEKTIGEDGGVLSLIGTDGTQYTMNVAASALIEESVSMRMSEPDTPVMLPDGFTPIATVQLEPAGTTFADFPRMSIRPAGPHDPTQIRVAFIASDDGSTVEFRPLLGDDLVAAMTAPSDVVFDVPHFSKIGVAIANVEAIFQSVGPQSSAEIRALVALLEHLREKAMEQLEGTGPGTIDLDLVRQILQPWEDSLASRSGTPNATDLSEYVTLGFETQRRIATAQNVGLIASRDSDQTTANLFGVLRNRLLTFEGDCAGGAAAALTPFLAWTRHTGRVFSGYMPDSYRADKPVISCLISASTMPEGPFAGFVGEPDIEVEATVTGVGGVDLSGAAAAIGTHWDHLLGLNQSDGATVFLDTEFAGARESVVDFSLFRLAEPVPAQAIIVHDHRGARQMFVEGFAACTNDPEDSGLADAVVPVSITSQSVAAGEPVSTDVVLAGSGTFGNFVIDSISITANYDQFTETTVDGTATGQISFTETETDPDTGETIVTTGTLNLGSGTAPDDLFVFSNVSGSDSSGCQLNGMIGFGQVSQ